MTAAARAIVTLLAGSAVEAATLHVCPDGTGDYPDLRTAVESVADGDVLELCDGTFSGPDNLEIDLGTKSLTIRSLNGPDATEILPAIWDPIFEEYAPHGAFSVGAASMRFEGITIRAARRWENGEWGDGAAIHCVGGALTLDRVRIVGRHYDGARRGAGIFLQGGSLTATDCEFVSNASRQEGGAIYTEDVTLSLTRCSFGGNSACWQGVVSHSGDATIRDCSFVGNCCGCLDGAGPAGTPLVIRGGSASILGCRFSDNATSSDGGVLAHSGTDVLIEDCVFDDCSSEVHAAALAVFGTTEIRRTVFRASYGAMSGAAVECGGSARFEHCTFVGNRIQGGVVLRAFGSATLLHCTFVANEGRQSPAGGVIDVRAGAVVSIEHSILAFNGTEARPATPVLCSGTPGELEVTCTDIHGNFAGDWVGCIAGLEGTLGNISADPLFCDMETGDFHLRASSPCAPPQSGECDLIGALGVGCGTTALDQTSWGRIKGMYR